MPSQAWTVSHENTLPCPSTDQIPTQHELIERFFFLYDQRKSAPFVAQEMLWAWNKKSNPWLELSDIRRDITEIIIIIGVTAVLFYMGMREGQNSHAYW